VTFKELARGDLFTTKDGFLEVIYIRTEQGRAIDLLIGSEWKFEPDMAVKTCKWLHELLHWTAKINRFIHRIQT
jgi:hypothetical protein